MIQLNIAIILLIALLKLPSASVAQSILWSKSYGGPPGESFLSVVETHTGDLVFCGYAESIGENDENSHGDLDGWIVRTDSNGEIKWEGTYGGSETDVFYDILELPNGDMIAVGGSRPDVLDVPKNTDFYDYWIIRVSGNGELVWSRSFGGSRYDMCRGVSIVDSAHFVVVGGSASIDGDIGNNNGSLDYWILKMNIDGELIWNRSLGGSSADFAYDVELMNENELIIAGSSYSQDGQVTDNNGRKDMWIVKLDINGEIISESSFGGSQDDDCSDISLTTDGGFLYSGDTQSPEINNDKVFDPDGWIIKTNDVGDVEWHAHYGGSGNDWINASVAISSGGYILTGATNSSDGDLDSILDSYDAWIIAIDDQGNLKWSITMGGSESDGFNEIIELSDGTVVLVGHTYSADNDLVEHKGENDAWVVKIRPDVSSLATELTPQTVQVYPNPASKYIKINVRQAQYNWNYRIYSMNGKLLSDGITSGSVDISDLEEGNYILYLSDSDNNMIGSTVFTKLIH